MIPSVIQPYLTHPLVSKMRESDLELLDTPLLNNIIRSEDLMIRGVREYYLNTSNQERLNPGQFSSSILLARGLVFLDVAHYNQDVQNICNNVWRITPTTAKRASFNQNINKSVIPRLEYCGIIEFDSAKQHIIDYMPYPVGSKLFVQKNLIENPKLLEEQSNHYSIIGGVQDFPELTSVLETNSKQQQYFSRDYNALKEIVVIREQEIRGRSYTFSSHFLAGDKSTSIWLQLLEDVSDSYRIALKSLMDLLGDLGGFVSHHEIVDATGLKAREVNYLMRNIDNLGISQRTHTLDMEDALSRITSGTLLGMNYHDLNNAQSLLVLMRQVPEAVEMLNLLQSNGILVEDELTEKFDSVVPVQKTRNSLSSIGLIKPDKIYEGIWELTPNKGNDKFISDVLAVTAHSRHVLPPDLDLTNILEDQFKNMDQEKFRRGAEQLKLDAFSIAVDESKK